MLQSHLVQPQDAFHPAELKKTSRMQSKHHNPHLKSPRCETNDNISLFQRNKDIESLTIIIIIIIIIINVHFKSQCTHMSHIKSIVNTK